MGQRWIQYAMSYGFFYAMSSSKGQNVLEQAESGWISGFRLYQPNGTFQYRVGDICIVDVGQDACEKIIVWCFHFFTSLRPLRQKTSFALLTGSRLF